MNRFAIPTLAASIALGALGCDDHGHPHDAATPANSAQPTTAPSGDHGHDHGPGADHAHVPPSVSSHDLGSVVVGGYTLKVTQTSAVTAGKEADFTLEITAGTGEPSAIRLWIGVESAEGSMKVRTHKHGSKIEAHVDAPDPLPESARLWIEVETPAGRQSAPVTYK